MLSRDLRRGNPVVGGLEKEEERGRRVLWVDSYLEIQGSGGLTVS